MPISKKNKILGYKIRDPRTNLYLSSVSLNKWTKIGKTWPRRGDAIRAVNAGLRALHRMKKFNNNLAEKVIDDCLNWELIELKESGSYPLTFLIDKIKLK